MTLEINDKPQKWFTLLWYVLVISYIIYSIWNLHLIELGTLSLGLYSADKLLNEGA